MAHTSPMAKRSVKSLHRTGRVSRKRAKVVARRLRAELASGEIAQISGKRIGRETTASGRSAIAFHVVPTKSGIPPKSRTARKAGRRAVR
jgi:hypothetical protein